MFLFIPLISKIRRAAQANHHVESSVQVVDSSFVLFSCYISVWLLSPHSPRGNDAFLFDRFVADVESDESSAFTLATSRECFSHLIDNVQEAYFLRGFQ
jgi:hypothetical protein